MKVGKREFTQSRFHFYIMAFLLESPEGVKAADLHEEMQKALGEFTRRTLTRHLDMLREQGKVELCATAKKTSYWKIKEGLNINTTYDEED